MYKRRSDTFFAILDTRKKILKLFIRKSVNSSNIIHRITRFL